MLAIQMPFGTAKKAHYNHPKSGGFSPTLSKRFALFCPPHYYKI